MPGLRVTVRTPRAYSRPASSAICALRGNRCCPCQCSPVTPTFHSTVPRAARDGSASPTCRSASTTAGCVGGYSRIRRKVVPTAPSARSIPAASAAMALALDPLSPVFEPEYPRGEARGRDRVVRADGHPVHVAPRLGGATGPTRVLRHHLLGPLDPHAELGRPQVHPPSGGGGVGIT